MRRRWMGAALAGLLVAGGAAGGWAVTHQGPELRYRPYTLYDVMGRFQRFLEKLQLAGAAGNWELADWYLGDFRHVANDLVLGRASDWRGERYHEADLTRDLLLPAFAPVEAAITARDPRAFAASMEGLAQACNACHAAADHALVRIVVPQGALHPSQRFEP